MSREPTDDPVGATLEGLPDPTPPAALQAAVLDQVARPRAARWRWVPWLAAAAVLVWLLRPVPSTHRLLVAGTEIVRGQSEVRVPGATVMVDGLVRIDREPISSALRERLQDTSEDDMGIRVRQLLVGGVAGALLTVTVVEGRARVEPEGAPPFDVAAGERRTIGHEPVRATIAPSPPAPQSALERELEELRVQNQILRGQLDMHGGTVVPWPEAPEYRPEGFTSLVAEVFPDVPVARDCEEFPCIAVLRLDGEASRAALDDQAREVWMALNQTVEPRLPAELKPQWYTYTTVDPDGQPVVITTYYPEDLAPLVENRVEERLGRLQEQASEGLGLP